MDDKGSHFVYFRSINYEKDLKSFSVHFIFSIVVILWYIISCVYIHNCSGVIKQNSWPRNFPFRVSVNHAILQHTSNVSSVSIRFSLRLKHICIQIHVHAWWLSIYPRWKTSICRVIKVHNVNLTYWTEQLWGETCFSYWLAPSWVF